MARFRYALPAKASRIAVMAAGLAVVASGAAVAPAFSPPAHAATTYAVSATVPVGAEGSGGGIAVDARTHRAYVPSSIEGRVYVVDTSANSVVGSIAVGSQPTSVAIDTVPTAPVKQAAAATPAIVPTPVLQPPPTVFVGNRGNGTISVINSATNTVTSTITLQGQYVDALGVDPAAHLLYAAGTDKPVPANIDIGVIDEQQQKLIAGGGGGPTSEVFRQVAVDSGTHEAFAAACCSDLMRTETFTAPSSFSGSFFAAPGNGGVAVNSTTHKAYISNASKTVGAVSVYDESAKIVTAGVRVGANPTGVAVDSNTNVVYVANTDSNSVSVIDGVTNNVVATVPVGVNPDDIAVDASTHTAYVVNRGDSTVSVITRALTKSVTRLAGTDRFGTAVAVSKAEFPTGAAGAVVLARGDDYPDALVGAPLAAAKNAPLLLTAGALLPTATLAEIQRVLAPGGTVYVLGGTTAVPASVASQLTGLNYTVTRYSGASRFDTAVKVADALGDPGTVLLATGTNFPDALSAGVAAAKSGGVVLLTNGPTMPPATSAYLSAHPGTVYAVGGPAAQADPSATAIVGADRFQTAVDVATRFFSSPASVGFATGRSFPDALSGGGLLGHLGAPLLLVDTSSVPTTVITYVSGAQATLTKGSLFGGVNTIGSSVEDALDAIVGG
jgi:YVTN family beta-propeller protein